MKFRHTILTLFLMFSLLPLYALGTIAIMQNGKVVERTVTDNLEVISQAQIKVLDEFCRDRHSDLHLLSQTKLIQDALLVSLGRKDPSTAANRSYVDNLLLQRRCIYDYLCSLSLINANYILVSSSEVIIPGRTSALAYSIENDQRSDFYIGQVHQRLDQNGELLRTVPVYESVYYDNELIGYLVAEIPTSYFDSMRQTIELTESCTIYLTDKNEKIITAGTARSDSSLTEYVTTQQEREEYSSKWQSIDFDTTPSGSFRYTVNGKQYITYYSTIEHTDWIMRITTDLSFYDQASESFRVMLILTLLILSIGMLILNACLSHTLTKPLNRIMSTLHNVRRDNDYSLRVDYHKDNEFGELAEQIDQLLSFAEITHQTEKAQRIDFQDKAEHDPLTGLYNKGAINHYIDLFLSEHETHEIVVGFVDIDNFRDYNTLYGHDAGDQVLQYVANTMRTAFGDGIGCNGGDEFLFWFPNTMSREMLETKLRDFLFSVNDGFHSDALEKNITISCSAGLAVGEATAGGRKRFIRLADQAMYHAKQQGKNDFHILSLQEM